MSKLQDSWNAFSPQIAETYLKSFGYPSRSSKRLLTEILKQERGSLKLIDLGCGNGQLAEYFLEQNLNCTYTGVDFSAPLLAVARRTFSGNDRVTFEAGDLQSLQFGAKQFDIAIFSHVIEIVGSPERALKEAGRIAKRIFIRFFEPPEFDETTVEIYEMNTGGAPLPYLRWKIGRDDYRLILSKIGIARVDVYKSQDKDQIHILNFA